MAGTDGNDLTAGDPTWMPFITTPPYPDWPSGLLGVVGSVTTVLKHLNPDGRVDLTVHSNVANEDRYFEFKRDMVGPAIDARVWSGIHFRTADEVSVVIGTWSRTGCWIGTSNRPTDTTSIDAGRASGFSRRRRVRQGLLRGVILKCARRGTALNAAVAIDRSRTT